MSKFIIQGQVPLMGTVQISGDKNTALKILAATILCSGESVLQNIPDIQDVRTILGLLEFLGAEYSFENNVVRIVTDNVQNKELPLEKVKMIRASIMFLGPMLARFGEVRIGFPGGCVIGKRSVSTHLDGLEGLGAKVIMSNDFIHLKAEKLSGVVIMSELSVTATENVLIAAAGSEEDCQIRLAALEPSVVDLANFLVKCGAVIEGIGTPFLKVCGSKGLKGVSYSIIPDRIEAATFAVIAVGIGDGIRIEKCDPSHMDAFLNRLQRIGAEFVRGKDFLEFQKRTEKFLPISNFDTRTYPGFATDQHPPLAVLLTQTEGDSRIFETIFESRLQYLVELEKMGAKISYLNSREAVVHGPTKLIGTTVTSHDLRAGAAMVIAGLMAEGETVVDNIAYIDRGYERFEEKLRSLGAEIRRV